ncbi:hypothetical protein C8R47DRAFT_472446 [Mycena vitilis]|nr:hypothetical protein C8R47DRAFT_472446 [Mycena vitilis]
MATRCLDEFPLPPNSNLSNKRPLECADETEATQPEQKRVRGWPSPVSRSCQCPHSASDRLPDYCDAFPDFHTRPSVEFVDKTRCILSLPDKFRYILLRPPRFGKTTFLSTLVQYYDIRDAHRFTEQFGSLAVTSEADHRRSQHLCLSFPLSEIYGRSDITDMASQLDSIISFALITLLTDYASELNLSDPRDFLGDRSGDILGQVFDRVREYGHTLFVAVDDYDGPTQTRSLAQSRSPDKTFDDVRDIERLLDSSFWAPLLAGSDIIDKLFITGTFSMKSAALEGFQLSDLPVELHSCCGFTEQEALEYARSILGKAPDVEELRHSCGNYFFLPQGAGGGSIEPVLHPQRVIDYIAKLAHERSRAEDRSFRLLSNIFGLLPKESSNPAAVSVNGLIQLLAAGAVDCEMDDSAFDFDFDFDSDTPSPTCKALYYAGALTCDPLPRSWRVASAAVLTLIHSCIDSVFADRHELQWRFFPAWRRYHSNGNAQPLLDLMSEILRDLALRSLGRKHEPNLRGVFELVMRNWDTKSDHPIDPIILLPLDVTRVEIPAYDSDQVHVWELKTVTLRGMWQATNLNDDEPTIEALEALHEELVDLEEDELLARPYRVWSPTLNAMETVLVSSFFDPEPEVPQFLAVGGVRILMRQRLEEEDEDEGQEEEELDSEGGQEEQEQEEPQEDGDDICLDS